MAAPAAKPARRTSPLVDAALALGATPIEPDAPEETPMDDNPDTYSSTVTVAPDTIEIQGLFDGFPLTYITTVRPDSLNIDLAELTSYLREVGIQPITFEPAPAPSPQPSAPQNSGGNRDNWNDGSQVNAGAANGWQTCGHGSVNAEADAKFGGMRCKFSSPTEFPNSRYWQSNDGRVKYFCKVNSRGGGR